MFGVLDLGVGNIQSVVNAFAFLGVDLERINRVDQINKCQGLVFPGVGSFGSVMGGIRKLNLEYPLREYIFKEGHVLAICVGLQILCNSSEESKDILGLSILNGSVSSLKNIGCNAKIPHVGFNTVNNVNLLFDRPENYSDDFYFVHSYALDKVSGINSISTTKYGEVDFISGLKTFNVIGTQFHPEKSGLLGLEFLRKYIECSRN
jgi:imidazole glycerol phosphate synthase glutamine amidotransferase subunit